MTIEVMSDDANEAPGACNTQVSHEWFGLLFSLGHHFSIDIWLNNNKLAHFTDPSVGHVSAPKVFCDAH